MIDIFDEVIEMADVSTKVLAEQNRLLCELSKDPNVPRAVQRKILTTLARTRATLEPIVARKILRETV